MIVTILIIIICALVGFIIWAFKEIVSAPNHKDQPKPIKSDSTSVMGATKSIALIAKPKEQEKHTARVAQEDIDDLFNGSPELDIDVEEEHDEQEGIEDRDDVINTQGEAIEEDREIQRVTCLDYQQIESSAKSVIRGKAISSDSKHTLQQMEGTALFEQLTKAINEDNLLLIRSTLDV